MSVLRDMVVSALIVIFTAMMQYVVWRFASPQTSLYDMATSPGPIDTASYADWYLQIGILWIPLCLYAIAFAYPIVRIYRYDSVGVVQ